MLQINGAPVEREQYTRLPMKDGIGQVTAILKWNRAKYRPLGGTNAEKMVRARQIQADLGGELATYNPNSEQEYVAVTVWYDEYKEGS